MEYQLTFYVPKNDAERVKEALFAMGAGRVGDYDKACWQTLGQGQFRPLQGSNPTIGNQGELTFVNEYKVEMVCSKGLIHTIVQKLIEIHPYEEPAFTVIKLESFGK